jgi:hypothetical protein
MFPAMTGRELTYDEVRSRRERTVARRRRLDAGLPPHRREQLRCEHEAEVLRRLGTPEHLIPIGTDDEVAAQRVELVHFARRLRAAAERG